MENKILIKILIVLVFLLVLGIIMFSRIFGESTEKEEIKKNTYEDTPIISVTPHENKYEAGVINSYYSYLSTDERDYIDTEIDSLLEKLNQKKYEELYAMLQDEYKRYLFSNNIEKFKKYMDEEFSSNCYCLNYRVTYYGCFLKLGFEGNTEKNIEIQLQNFKEDSLEGVKLFFDDVIEIVSITDTFQTPEIMIGQNFILKYPDKTSICVALRNKTEQKQTVDFEKSKLVVTNGADIVSYDTLGDTTTTLSSKENKSFLINFNFTDDNIYNADTIAFRVKVGETLYGYNSYMQVDNDLKDYEED